MIFKKSKPQKSSDVLNDIYMYIGVKIIWVFSVPHLNMIGALDVV